jgi:hypothetical protein
MLKFIFMENEQLDKRIKKYFDWKFENSVIGREDVNHGDDKQPWYGFWNKPNDELILGYPMEGIHDPIWFSNGPHFLGGWDLYGITGKEFNDAMKRYLEKKYPHLKIYKIM